MDLVPGIVDEWGEPGLELRLVYDGVRHTVQNRWTNSDPVWRTADAAWATGWLAGRIRQLKAEMEIYKP